MTLDVTSLGVTTAVVDGPQSTAGKASSAKAREALEAEERLNIIVT
jgi:hypothetical protein